MATQIGEVYVEVGADASGVGTEAGEQIQREMRPAGRRAGEQFVGSLKKWGMRALKGGALAMGVAAASSLVAGVSQGLKQQTATKVLAGLYDDADVAKNTIAELNKVAANSPLNSLAFQEGAASLAYAGVQGKDVVRVLENVGKSIVSVGGDSESMQGVSDAILEMVNRGEVGLDTINRISHAGVPILSAFGEAMGKSIGEVREMASNGEISLQQVIDILRDAPGESFAASLRAGEQAATSLANQVKIAWGNLTTTIGERLQPLIEGLTPIMQSVAENVRPAINGIADAFTAVWKVIDPLKPLIGGLAAAMAVFTGAILVQKGVMFAYNFVLGASAKAWKVLNGAIRANPIMAIVSLVIGLIAVLVTAYKKSETFRRVVDAVWAGIKKAFSAAWDVMEPVVMAIVGWFRDTIPPIMSKAREIIVGVWEKIKGAFMTVWDAVGPVLSKIFGWVGDKLPGAFNVLKTIIKAVLLPVKIAFQVLWAIVKVVFAGIKWYITNVVVPIVTFLWEHAFKPVLTWIGDKLNWLWQNVVKPVFDFIKKWISAAWKLVIEPVFQAIGRFISDTLAPAFQWFWNKVIKPVWDRFKKIVDTAWNNGIKGIFQAIKNFVSDVLGPAFRWLWNNVISPVWNGIKTTISVVWTFIRDKIFNPLKTFITKTIPRGFRAGRDAIKRAWNAIKQPLKAVWNFLRDKVFDPLSNLIKNTIPNAFERGKDAIGNAWEGIKNLAKKPVNFVIDTVYNSGIRKLWNAVATKFGASKLSRVPKLATGGAVFGPGGPTDDRVPAMLSNQEHVWSAKEVKGAGGHLGVARLRAMAKNGQMPGFSLGGWLADRWSDVKSVASGAWNSISDVASHLADPIGWIKDSIGSIMGGIGNSGFAQMLTKIPSKILSTLKDKVTDLFSFDAGGGGPLPVSGGWVRPSRGPITSRYGPRWGAFHSGVDIAGGGPTYAAKAGQVARVGWNTLAGHTGIGILLRHAGGWSTYYGHNPPGGVVVSPGQMVAQGQHIGAQGATGNVTGTHVHFTVLKNGRIVSPRTTGLFDTGGILRSGQMAVNNSGRPERVLNPRQTEHFEKLTSSAHRAAHTSTANSDTDEQSRQVRLDTEDMDYLADKVAERLWPTARAADTVQSLADRGRTIQRQRVTVR